MTPEAIADGIDHYTAMYARHVDSRDPTDCQHAEIYRLAAIVLREVRLERIDEQEAARKQEPYTATPPADVLTRFRSLCANYLATGQRLDNRDEDSDLPPELAHPGKVDEVAGELETILGPSP